MEPELIVLEECNRFFIVQQRWGFDDGKSRSESWHKDDPDRDLFPVAYIFTVMAGPYARVYKEWTRYDSRKSERPMFAYIVEARNKRQVVDEMVRRGHPSLFNHKFHYPEEYPMKQHGVDFGSDAYGNGAAHDPDIAALQRTIERAQAKIDFLASLPDEPAIDEDGVAVIYFRKKFSGSGRLYDYAAIKAGDGKWYTTGPASPKGYTWNQLIRWMVDGHPGIEVLVATEWTAL